VKFNISADVLWEYIEKIQMLLQLHTNMKHFTWRPGT